jgi:SSS family solute:Na+ symporter
LPELADSESSYPEMIKIFLPTGLKGLMIAAMFAAFMSTIDTHLNWGASYIVNDLYVPYISKNKEGKHYLLVSRVFTFVFMIIAILIATKLKSLLGAYKYISVVFGGISTVMIARWYWWRVNSFAEISGIIASLIIANFLELTLPSTKEHDFYAVRLAITVFLVTIVWITVTLITCKGQPSMHLIDFYKKIRIPGPGWEKVRLLANMEPEKDELKYNFLGWFCCVIFIYSMTIGIGKLLFQEFFFALFFLCLSLISGAMLFKILKKMAIFKSD